MKAVLIQLSVRGAETPEQRSQRVQVILSRLLERHKQCDLLLMPELWKVGFPNFESYTRLSEPPQGNTTRIFSRWAKRLSCTMIPGSFLEKGEDGKLRNAMPLMTSDSKEQVIYHKMHLFGYQSQEPQLLTAGQKVITAQTPIGRVGLATCYDLRFPEQFRAMVDQGAEVLCVAAAWPYERRNDWRLLCRTRAMENQCWLFACNNVGTHSGMTGGGHSMAVAPDGTVVAEAGTDEEILIADFDPGMVQCERERFPVLRDRVEIQ